MGFCPSASFCSDPPSTTRPMSLWSCCQESTVLLSPLPCEWALGATGQAGGWDQAPAAQTAPAFPCLGGGRRVPPSPHWPRCGRS